MRSEGGSSESNRYLSKIKTALGLDLKAVTHIDAFQRCIFSYGLSL